MRCKKCNGYGVWFDEDGTPNACEECGAGWDALDREEQPARDWDMGAEDCN